MNDSYEPSDDRNKHTVSREASFEGQRDFQNNDTNNSDSFRPRMRNNIPKPTIKSHNAPKDPHNRN